VPARAEGLPVSALHDGGDVAARVRQLVADPVPSASPAPRKAMGTVAAAAWAAVALTLAAQTLPAVHELIEVAARLLR
jgi:hypothetical protein